MKTPAITSGSTRDEELLVEGGAGPNTGPDGEKHTSQQDPSKNLVVLQSEGIGGQQGASQLTTPFTQMHISHQTVLLIHSEPWKRISPSTSQEL